MSELSDARAFPLFLGRCTSMRPRDKLASIAGSFTHISLASKVFKLVGISLSIHYSAIAVIIELSNSMCSTNAPIITNPDQTMFLILRSSIGLGGTLSAVFVQEVVLIRDLIGFVVREVLLRSVWIAFRLHDLR